jgi:hypothetical protein
MMAPGLYSGTITVDYLAQLALRDDIERISVKSRVGLR